MKADLTVIEITDTQIKLLTANLRRNIPVLRKCLIRDIKENADEQVVQVLKEMAARLEGSPDEVNLILPRRFVMLKQISLPSSAEDEIRRMVNLQLSNHVPYNREDVVFDFTVLRKDASGYTVILAVFAQKEIVQRYLKLLHKAQMSSQRVVLSSMAILEGLQAGKRKISKDEQGGVEAVVSVDYAHMEVCFAQQKNLLFSRSINYGSRDFKPVNLPAIMEQLSLTFAAYYKEQMGEDVKRVVLLTDSGGVSFLQEVMGKLFSYPMEVILPSEDMVCERNFDRQSLRVEEGISLRAALGAFSSPVRKPINLIPPEVIDLKRMRLRRKAVTQFIITCAFTVLLGLGALFVEVYQDELFLQKIQDRVAETKKGVKKAEHEMQYIQFVNDRMQHHVFFTDVLRELIGLIPEEMSFRSLGMDQKGMITIQGFAGAGMVVDQFQRGLVGSKMFKNVNLQYSTQRKRYRTEYTEFKITCQLVSAGISP